DTGELTELADIHFKLDWADWNPHGNRVKNESTTACELSTCAIRVQFHSRGGMLHRWRPVWCPKSGRSLPLSAQRRPYPAAAASLRKTGIAALRTGSRDGQP